MQRDGATVKVRFFGIFSTDGGLTSYSCNVSATGRRGAGVGGEVAITARSCAKVEGWGRTIGVISPEAPLSASCVALSW